MTVSVIAGDEVVIADLIGNLFEIKVSMKRLTQPGLLLSAGLS